MPDDLRKRAISYGIEVRNLINLDARRTGGIPEQVLVTETQTLQGMDCDPCREGPENACLAANTLLTISGLPFTTILSGLWRHLVGSEASELAGVCRVELPVGAVEYSYELLIDGDPKHPLSQATMVYQRDDGDMILTGHHVAMRVNRRGFPFAMGIARGFAFNPEAWDVDPAKRNLRSLVLVKVEFAKGQTAFIPLEDLSRVRF